MKNKPQTSIQYNEPGIQTKIGKEIQHNETKIKTNTVGNATEVEIWIKMRCDQDPHQHQE